MNSHPVRISEAFRSHVGSKPCLHRVRSLSPAGTTSAASAAASTTTGAPSTARFLDVARRDNMVASAGGHSRLADYPDLTTPDDMLLEEIMLQSFQFNTSAQQNSSGSLNVVSICSSLGSAFAYTVPQIILHYFDLAQHNPKYQALQDVSANVIHVIPQHKTIKVEPGDPDYDRQLQIHVAGTPAPTAASLLDSYSGVFEIHEAGTNYCIAPKNSILTPEAIQSLLKRQPSPVSPTLETLPIHKNYLHHNHFYNSSVNPFFASDSSAWSASSSHGLQYSLSPSPPSPLLSPVPTGHHHHHSHVDLSDRIFNTFAFMPQRRHAPALVVPRNSAHFNFALYPIPSHVLPPFADIIAARYAETAPGGLMVVCYPTSLKLYYGHILKCLDLALHQLLALNLISTQACEAITAPPQSPVASFAAQHDMLRHNLPPTAEIVYSRHVQNYTPAQWGYRWISEDMQWLRQTLAGFEVASHAVVKLFNTLARNPEWSAPTTCDISLFIVRKNA